MPDSLTGGPYDGQPIPANASQSVELPVDDRLRASSSDEPHTLAVYEMEPDGNYKFTGFKGNRPQDTVCVDMIGGPLPCKFSCFRCSLTERCPNFNENGGLIAVDEFALVLQENDWVYNRTDTFAEERELHQMKEIARTARQVAQHWYKNPNYAAYSTQPSEEHKQVPIALGERHANVDELIAPLILKLWSHGFDTASSCQERPTGKAFVALTVPGDAERLYRFLVSRDIECELRRTKQSFKHQKTGEIIFVPYGDITFSSAELEKITSALE
jgi:hypothetical protein